MAIDSFMKQLLKKLDELKAEIKKLKK